MSLAEDHKALSPLLNEDIFAAVIDEVIGWLNTYKTNDIIRLACTLRLVCQYANLRIRPIALSYLDIVSRKQLANLVLLGTPNAPYLRSITIRISDPISLFNGFFIDHTAFKALQCLRVVDHATPVAIGAAAASPGWFMQYPPSLTELSVITSSKLIAEGFGWPFQNPGTPALVLVKKLALFGVPLRHLPPAVEQVALSIATKSDLNIFWRFCRGTMMWQLPVRLRRIRLLFLSDDGQPTADHRLQLWRMPLGLEDVVVEQLQPVGDDAAAWFAERVEDGTIWTVPAVTLRVCGPPLDGPAVSAGAFRPGVTPYPYLVDTL